MAEITLPALSKAQVGEMVRLLARVYEISPVQSMERAGYLAALLAKDLLEGDLGDRPLLVLAGRGCNGGGGLAAARHLLEWGAWVQVLCVQPATEYAMPAAAPLQALLEMGAPLAWAEEGWELPPSDLVIDALVGTGLRGEPEGKLREVIQLANSSAAPILSLEAPSGVDLDSGECFTPHIRAAATLVLALPKVGMLAGEAREACGDLYLGDMAFPPALFHDLGVELPAIFDRDLIVRWDVVEGRPRVVKLP